VANDTPWRPENFENFADCDKNVCELSRLVTAAAATADSGKF
jgi:hypothetical protein